MRYITQGKAKGISKQTIVRIVAATLLVCLLLIPLLSEIFTLAHVCDDHGHDGAANDCTVCTYIHSLEAVRKQLGASAKDTAGLLIVLFLAAAVIYTALPFSKFQTPITLKVRINN